MSRDPLHVAPLFDPPQLDRLAPDEGEAPRIRPRRLGKSPRLGSPAHFFRSALPALLTAEGPVLRDGVVVRFEVEGPGGGTFDLVGRPGGQVESRPHRGPRDCTVRCHVRDWESCMAGRLSAMRAYADGRLQISGDVGLLLRIQDLLGERAA